MVKQLDLDFWHLIEKVCIEGNSRRETFPARELRYQRKDHITVEGSEREKSAVKEN